MDTKSLREIYKKDGIGGVLGYQSRVLVSKISKRLENAVVNMSGIIREPVEWDGIITQEGVNEFIRGLYKAQPLAERIYQGAHGGGILFSSCMLGEVEKHEARSKTTLGRIINSFQKHYYK